MKIDPKYLKFPKTLPNDEQNFMIYYPFKYPKVINYFEEKAKRFYNKPKEYAKFVQEEFNELEASVNKINAEYQAGNKEDLAFLIEIDQKFNKLFCFKFWVINYVFADGPIHEFYVDQLKAFARKIVDATDDVEEYEKRIIQLQRDLLQTDYADIYLVQALHGVNVCEFFEKDAFSKKITNKIIPVIDQHEEKQTKKIIKLWKPIVDRIMDEKDKHYHELIDLPKNFVFNTLLDLPPLRLPLNQVRMRGTPFPLYSFLNHTLEFRNENKLLNERHQKMKETIAEIFEEAMKKFSKQEYIDFKLSYEMSKCFSMSKDIMGNVDPILIPVWEADIHYRIYKIISKTQKVRYPSISHASVFASFVWYLPDNLKAKVLSVDNTPLKESKN